MEKSTSVLVLIFVITSLISAVGLSTLDLGCSLLRALDFDGHLDFDNTHLAATDFGNRHTAHPRAVLHPASVSDIATLVKSVYRCGSSSDLTIAARGHAHSLNGQAQAENGIVIAMESLKGVIEVKNQGLLYVDVNGGDLWIDVLHATLKEGFAPKSWTDYLHLTVGGTLSNAGISGQAFRHGPQINNVYQLEVVTGKGEVLNCSIEQNTELFHAVLGGLGQFGIITKARIALEPAPQRVKWIRVLYSDFKAFTSDQEYLISRPIGDLTFDYVEGFVAVNKEGLLNHWRSSFFSPENPVKVKNLNTQGRLLYCLEMTMNYINNDTVEQDVTSLLASLHFIPGSLFTKDISYLEFLDRVHTSELKLRSKGLWEVAHPWLNLLVPASKIHEFDKRVLKDILRNTSSGPILIYPMNTNTWDERMSAVTPEENNFYLVGLLASAIPSATGTDSVEYLMDRNNRIQSVCSTAGLGAKQYLPHYTTESDWKNHFGSKWYRFKNLKATYDPYAILAPGQRIFSRSARSLALS